MDKKPLLYVIIEVKARELEGRALLAMEAAARGFRVVLGYKPAITMGLKAGLLPSGIFFEKSLTKGKEKKLKDIISTGCQLACQDEESGLLSESYDGFLSYRSTPETVKMADSIFCWGEHDYEAWTRTYPQSADKIHVTGSPRVDFWRPDFSGYFQHKSNFLRRRFGRFILVASNFSAACGYFTTEERILQCQEKGIIKTGTDEKAMRKKIEDSTRMFNAFTALVAFLSEKHSDTHFVVRPHPVEKHSGWKQALAEYGNTSVIFQGGISQWVRASSAILHNGCTTALEAYASGVPAIAYVPFQSPVNREIPNRLSLKCSTPGKVSDIICRIEKGEKAADHRTEENNKLFASRLDNISGQTAAERIAEELKQLKPRSQPAPEAGIRAWKIALKIDGRRILNRIRGRETRFMRKFPYLKLDELLNIKANIGKTTDRHRNCRIKHLYGDVFMFEQR